MFAWLYRWMGWDRTVTPPRLLFWFSDWSGTRSIDPLVTERTLVAEYGPDWQDALTHVAEQPPADADRETVLKHYAKICELREKLFAAITKAFKVTDYDPATEQGVSDLQKLYLLREFIRYHRGLAAYLAGG
jgi:hypothetical protein